jgi:hypothetical protein
MAIIKPSTILVVFCNVLIFMLMEILLFWYVISKAIEDIIVDKTSIVYGIINNSTRLRTQFNKYVQSEEYAVIYNQSLVDGTERTNFNVNLTWEWMLSPFLIVIIMLFLGLFYTIYVHRCSTDNTLKLDKTDFIILAMVFLSFLTEIIVIFVLIMRYVYISDMEIIIFFMNFALGNFIPTDLPIDFSAPTNFP